MNNIGLNQGHFFPLRPPQQQFQNPVFPPKPPQNNPNYAQGQTFPLPLAPYGQQQRQIQYTNHTRDTTSGITAALTDMISRTTITAAIVKIQTLDMFGTLPSKTLAEVALEVNIK